MAQKSSFAINLEYGALRAVTLLLNALPYAFALALARGFGWLLVVVFRFKRQRTLARIRGVPTDALTFSGDLILTLSGTEYLVPPEEILFFESRDDKVAAHTSDRMYYTDKTLAQLSDCLGPAFARVSKSCIVGLTNVHSLHRELTGICEVHFTDCDKKIFVSRMYYHDFRERLETFRVKKIFH